MAHHLFVADGSLTTTAHVNYVKTPHIKLYQCVYTCIGQTWMLK